MWRAVMALALVIAPLAVGCGPSGPRMQPVTVKVSFNGQAPVGAIVTLRPSGGGPDALVPSGAVGEDGVCKLRTYPHGEGVPEGDYRVAVSWYPEDARTAEGGAKNRMPAKYEDPETSGIKATVGSDTKELPAIDLKS